MQYYTITSHLRHHIQLGRFMPLDLTELWGVSPLRHVRAQIASAPANARSTKNLRYIGDPKHSRLLGIRANVYFMLHQMHSSHWKSNHVSEPLLFDVPPPLPPFVVASPRHLLIVPHPPNTDIVPHPQPPFVLLNGALPTLLFLLQIPNTKNLHCCPSLSIFLPYSESEMMNKKKTESELSN